VNRRDALALAASAAAMLAVRLRRAAGASGPGEVLLGVDAWYHWRAARWTAANWPATLAFDPYTSFPHGAEVGQFGTPWDLLLATTALAAGGGDAASGLWAAAALPALAAAACLPAVWYIARRERGSAAGAAAAGALALTGGSFLARTSYGFIDHHAAEVALQAAAMALAVASVRRAGTRAGAALAAAAGAALGLYMLVWPPALYFVAVLGAGLVAAACSDYARGGRRWEGPLTTAFGTGAVAAAVVGPHADPGASGLTSLGLPHLLAPVCLAGGAFALVASLSGAEPIRRRRARAAASVAGLAAGGLAVAALAGLTDETASWGSRFLVGASENAQTVTEARSVDPGAMPSFLLSEYGLLAVLAAAGAAVVLRRRRLEGPLLAAWLLATLVMTAAQVRSAYYLALPVAVLAGLAASRGAELGLEAAEPERPRAAATVAALLLVVAAAAPAAGALAARPEPGAHEQWEGALDWLEESTPEPGMGYHSDFGRPRDHDYSDGAYGVLTWWDYGHLVTADARRPAVANPFQEHAGAAARYLLARGPGEREDALDGLGAGPGERVRYVAVDDLTATSKLWAVSEWAGYGRAPYRRDGAFTPAFRESTLGRLYLEPAPSMPRHRLVYESRETSLIAGSRGPGGYGPSRVSRGELERLREPGGPEPVLVTAAPSVRVYERVEGAVLAGRANGTVVARLELRTSAGRRVVYERSVEAGGRFGLRVAYPTTGHGAVEAVGPYRVSVDGDPAGSARVAENEVRSGAAVTVSQNRSKSSGT
jgi:dolichyl-diphosphooligosaccharide--protein glycosyltransferase